MKPKLIIVAITSSFQAKHEYANIGKQTYTIVSEVVRHIDSLLIGTIDDLKKSLYEK